MVRDLLAIALLAGCYSPATPAGVPCDPAIDNCPQGQVCRADGAGFSCGAPGTGAPPPDSRLVDTAGDPPLDAPPPQLRLEYAAVVAECIDPLTPSPQTCRNANGAEQMVVDLEDTTAVVEWRGYIHFVLDDRLAGRLVTGVTLRATATDDPDAAASNAGDVWLVEPFTVLSLNGTTPPRIGDAPIALSPQAVSALEPIDWKLPVDIVAPAGDVYLSLANTTASGVNYWNIDGVDPPQLFVDVE